MKNVLLILAAALVAVGGYALYQWVRPEEAPVVRSSAKRTGSPVSKLAMEKGTVRSAKDLHLSRKDDVGTGVEEKDLAKQSKPVAELDAKFATWRDDGRKAVEDMFGGDRQKIGEAFRAAMANEEFRTNSAACANSKRSIAPRPTTRSRRSWTNSAPSVTAASACSSRPPPAPPPRPPRP